MGAVAAQAACREDPTVEVAGRARAERTRNMFSIFVTLVVSQLSGWSNALVYCRVQREASEERAAHAGRGWEGVGRWRREQCAGRIQLQWLLAGARAEST